MSLPDSNKCYKDSKYWDARYQEEESYEWLKSYSSFRHLVHEHVQPSDTILMIGCGNSTLSVDMYVDGYEKITNTDISSVCIQNQNKKYKHDCPKMKWLVVDMTDMNCFDTSSFDVIIEKATIDTLLVAETDSLISDSLHEISRLLKDGGRFISITFDQPHFRIPLYAKLSYNWSLNFATFCEKESFHFFFFAMVKGESLDEDIIKRNTLKRVVQTVVESDDVHQSSDDEENFFKHFNIE